MDKEGANYSFFGGGYGAPIRRRGDWARGDCRETAGLVAGCRIDETADEEGGGSREKDIGENCQNEGSL